MANRCHCHFERLQLTSSRLRNHFRMAKAAVVLCGLYSREGVASYSRMVNSCCASTAQLEILRCLGKQESNFTGFPVTL